MITVAACAATALLTWMLCGLVMMRRERRMRLQLREFMKTIRDNVQ